MKELKIGFLQQHNTADTKDNILRLCEGISDLAKRGAQLIVLQELHNSLYFCQVENVDNFDLAEPVPGPSTKIFGELAKQFGVDRHLPLRETGTRAISQHSRRLGEGRHYRRHLSQDAYP